MANELVYPGDTGDIIYARAWKDGQVWNGTALENWTPANVATYTLTITDKLGGVYYGNLPALSPVGNWVIIYYKQAGGSPAVGDKVYGVEYIYWDGTVKAAVKASTAAATMILGTVDSTGFAPTITEFEADDIIEATADHFKGRVVLFTSNTLINQATVITAYALVGGRGHFTVVGLTEAPANDTTFIIV